MIRTRHQGRGILVVVTFSLFAVWPVSRAAAAGAGDIPDTQVFVPFTSPAGGYTLEVPEGWARTTHGADVRFTSGLDGLSVTLTPATAPPTLTSARGAAAAVSRTSGRAGRVTKAQNVRLPGGSAVLLTSTSESQPDAVTGKSVRLENNTYLFFRHDKQAALRLWAPLGADNVDQWRRIARSFRWR